MNDFCMASLTIAPDLRADHGILRLAAMAITTDATLAAERIVKRAQAEAEVILQGAQAQAQQAVQKAEQHTLVCADQLLQRLRQTQATFLAGAEQMVLDLAQGLFDRLVVEMTPRERIESALRRVLCEVPPRLVHTLLRVHPNDLDLLPAVEWDVKADPSLSPGMCRLEASHGEWCVDFGAAVAALKMALARAIQNTGECDG